ncbi:MAG: hypothetical protein IPM82_13275 [Saprospiraceae bacterium]|nr:hypothetical protein [Saprospiraceae bacterium]
MKKILSYLVDIQLDTASTALNPVLLLSLRNGRFYLTTTNAVYSHGDLYDNFLRTFQKLDFTKNKFNSILVLGFGMGSVPYMLERVFLQKFHCTGVEADGKIAEWAERYVLPEMTNPVKLHLGDAIDFIEKCGQQFDLVVMDVFLDDVVPMQFESLSFLQNLKKCITPVGLLLFNRLSDTPEALASTKSFFDEKFRQIFPEASYLDVEGNWMLANRAAWA